MKKLNLKSKWRLLSLLLLLFFSIKIYAQQNIGGQINIYTPVQWIDADCNTPNIGVESSVGFSIGDDVLLIQMKGASIDNSNSLSYGNITNYNNSGNYEFNKILSISGGTIFFQNKIIKTYSPGSPNFVQLVRIPHYPVDVTVTSPIVPQSWNAATGTGGIIAFFCDGTVTLNANIDAKGFGFKGGISNKENPNSYSPMPLTPQFFFPSFPDPGPGNPWLCDGGGKGEGIAHVINAQELGRGKLANGGGGGNHHNAGGSGGGNHGFGGAGGNDLNNNEVVGGIRSVSLNYNLGKIFLGGGGGGGHKNDNGTANGGNGGGIIIIKANIIVGNNKTILADGNACSQSNDDGAGGGGAGGTIILTVNSFNTSNTNITAVGGKGGNSTGFVGGTVPRATGPGGGGGGGVICFSGSSLTPSNTTTSVAFGQPGTNNGWVINMPAGTDNGAEPGQVGQIYANSILETYDCMAKDFPEIFHPIPSATIPQLITTDMVLTGKYFITGIINIQNAELDLTNVDMVFAVGARLEFSQNATLRANNSVFRPCNQLQSWGGLRFWDGSKAIINECIIKNAQLGVVMINTGFDGDVNITGTEFSNCKVAIACETHSNNEKFRGSITNNIFSIDKSEIDYTPDPWTTENYYTGIACNDIMETTISQNNFINNGFNVDPCKNKNFTGIILSKANTNDYKGASATISKNTFTNMNRGIIIELTDLGSCTIENNAFEVTQKFDFPIAQVYLKNNNAPILLFNNKFSSTSSTLSNFAIRSDFTNNLDIISNEAIGFDTSFCIFGCNNLMVSSNTLTDFLSDGIKIINGIDMTVSCNYLKSKDKIGLNFISDARNGIVSNNNLSILSNCFFDFSTAIQLTSWHNPPIAGYSTFIPKVINNYLYNYSANGLNLIQFTSFGLLTGIGSGYTFPLAGRNSFISNSQTAVDINSTMPIWEAGNFNLLNLSANVVALPGAYVPFASTSTCGHQIYNSQNNNINEDLACNETQGGIQSPGAFVSKNKKQSINPNFTSYYKNAEEASKVNLLLSFFSIYSSNNSSISLEAMLSNYNLTGTLNNDEISLLKYQILKKEGANLETKTNFLTYLNIKDSKFKEFFKYEKLNLGLDQIEFGAAVLKDEDAILLSYGIDKDNKYFESSRDLIRFHRGEFFREIKPIETPTIITTIERRNLVNVNENNFNIFPNPSNGIASLNYSIPGASDIKIQITNTVGVLIKEISVSSYYGLIDLDFTPYTQGAYFIRFIANDKSVKTLKFIKL